MQIGVYSIVLLVSYLLGSVPTGYLVGRAKGVDIRKAGSGNIGATNAFRILGKKAGIFVLLMDALKGYAACVLAPILAMGIFPNSTVDRTTLGLAAGVAAILGHNYTCWLRFKGGKGIATTAGVLLALAPAAALTAVGVWLIIFLSTRYVSLASIAAALALPFAAWFWKNGALMTGVFTGLSILAIYKHKSNIQRLLNGTESRVGAKKKEESK